MRGKHGPLAGLGREVGTSVEWLERFCDGAELGAETLNALARALFGDRVEFDPNLNLLRRVRNTEVRALPHAPSLVDAVFAGAGDGSILISTINLFGWSFIPSFQHRGGVVGAKLTHQQRGDLVPRMAGKHLVANVSEDRAPRRFR